MCCFCWKQYRIVMFCFIFNITTQRRTFHYWRYILFSTYDAEKETSLVNKSILLIPLWSSGAPYWLLMMDTSMISCTTWKVMFRCWITGSRYKWLVTFTKILYFPGRENFFFMTLSLPFLKIIKTFCLKHSNLTCVKSSFPAWIHSKTVNFIWFIIIHYSKKNKSFLNISLLREGRYQCNERKSYFYSILHVLN